MQALTPDTRFTRFRAANDNQNTLLRNILFYGVLYSVAFGCIAGGVMYGIAPKFAFEVFLVGAASGAAISVFIGAVVYSLFKPRTHA